MSIQMFDDSTPYTPEEAQQLGSHLSLVPTAVEPHTEPKLSQPDDQRWYEESLCAQVDSDIFYPERRNGYPNYDMARTICTQCPVAQQCLEMAMSSEENTHYSSRHGMFGGKTPAERARLAKERSSTNSR